MFISEFSQENVGGQFDGLTAPAAVIPNRLDDIRAIEPPIIPSIVNSGAGCGKFGLRPTNYLDTTLNVLDPIGELDVGATANDRLLRYGLPLSGADYFANDMVVFGDGISKNFIYMNNNAIRSGGGANGKLFNLSLLAPSTALTATDEDSVNAFMRPTNNECYDDCGVVENRFNCTTLNWIDNSGNSQSNLCNNYQAVNEITADDDGYVSFRVNSQQGFNERVRWKLSTLAYTPNTADITIRIRAKYEVVGSPGDDSRWFVQLYQGNSAAGGTLIHQEDLDQTDLTESVWTNLDITVPSASVANITDYTNLYINIELESPATLDVLNHRRIDVSHAYAQATTSGSTGLAAGVYSYVYTYVRSKTGTESGPSPELVYTHSTTGCIILDDLVLSDDPDVDKIRIYRTTIGGSAFHLLVEINNTAPDNPTNGFYTDCIQDVDLTDAQIPILDITRKRSYRAWLPTPCRYFTTHLNRVFGAGSFIDAPISTDDGGGTITATNGSATITGANTAWTTRLEGRMLRLTSAYSVDPGQGAFGGPGGAVPPGLRDPIEDATQYAEKSYRVIKVNSTTELIVDRAWAEDGVTGGDYEIIDDRNPYTVYWSYPGFPEDWPVNNFIELPGAPVGSGGEGITGLFSHRGSLYIFTNDSIYVLSGDDESNFRADKVWNGVGCINGHTIVSDQRSNLIYFQGEDGYYGFDGQRVLSISAPPVNPNNPIISGIDISTDCQRQIDQGRKPVSLYDADYNCIHNFIAINSPGLYSYADQNQAYIYGIDLGDWSIDDTPPVVSAGRVYDTDGSRAYLIGDHFGGIWQLNRGYSDAIRPDVITNDASWDTQVSAVSSSDWNTITVAQVDSFVGESIVLNSTLSGCPAMVVGSTGEVFHNIIDTVSSSTIAFVYPLPILPDSEYFVIIGGIDLVNVSGWVDYGEPHIKKTLDYVEAHFEPGKLVSRLTGTPAQGGVYIGSSFDLNIINSQQQPAQLVVKGFASFTDGASVVDGEGVRRVHLQERGHHIITMYRAFIPGFDVRLKSVGHHLNVL